MRIAKDKIPAKINVPGAVARKVGDFGDASGLGKFGLGSRRARVIRRRP